MRRRLGPLCRATVPAIAQEGQTRPSRGKPRMYPKQVAALVNSAVRWNYNNEGYKVHWVHQHVRRPASFRSATRGRQEKNAKEEISPLTPPPPIFQKKESVGREENAGEKCASVGGGESDEAETTHVRVPQYLRQGREQRNKEEGSCFRKQQEECRKNRHFWKMR